MRPRSSRLKSAKATASPCSDEMRTPLRRDGSSPFTGAYLSNTWLLMPVPRVSVMNSMWKPMSPREGML